MLPAYSGILFETKFKKETTLFGVSLLKFLKYKNNIQIVVYKETPMPNST